MHSSIIYIGPILQSKGIGAIFQKKNEGFENLDKNVQNLKKGR